MVAAESCDVCIVGAGLAGMNALFVAGQYLGPGQRVTLLDRRPRVGGMWVDTYPYVRLHQPHPMFTAGNIAWTLDRDRGYLPSKPEVLDHFEHCLRQIRQRITVDERYGWDFRSEEPVAAGGVRITCRDGAGAERVVHAKRLIKAFGLGITPNPPLTLSSGAVRSVSPDSCDMRAGEIADSDAPVWIIGSGKTAMDTAYALIADRPGREVNLVAGSGTFFTNRERFFPTGPGRWWRGTTVSTLGLQLGHRYNGHNEDDVLQWLRTTHGVCPTAEAGHFLLGVLSEAENRTIAGGLNEVVMDHLVDVVDVDDGGATHLVLRSGATRVIEPGSWLVNCTGYFGVHDVPYEPYTDGHGSVLSIQPRSATLHLTSFAAYFMTHLMFLDKLADVPLYEMDVQTLHKRCKKAMPLAMFALAQYNLSLLVDELPAKVFGENGLNFDRWYPWPRRTAAGLQFLRTHRGQREQLRQTLDTVQRRFDVRCGPLESILTTSATAAG